MGKQRGALEEPILLQPVHGLAEGLEQRRAQLLQTERTVAALERLLGELGRGTAAVGQRAEQGRPAVRQQPPHRGGRYALPARRPARPHSRHAAADRVDRVRRQAVEEVQALASVITKMLGDIHVNLKVQSEQRAEIDHWGEQGARLDFTLPEAQTPLRSLQHEREVAERIEQGIKAPRVRA